MSEFLAEARILVRPDTTKFRALLEAELASAIRPISIPVVPVVASGLSSATAQTSAFTSAQASAAAETQAVAAGLETEAIATTKATAATSALSKQTAGLARGAGASSLSLLGVRGATLAASGAFLAGTAAVVAFSKSLQSAASLETELNVFKVTAGATADEMVRVSDAAKQLGRDLTLPGVTANTAATAMTELAKAGLSVTDSLAGARGALQLSTAAQIDVKDATNLVAGALNAFQLSGSEAVKVADLLTGAAKESQGEITDMGTALSQVAAVSQQVGVSIGDTVTLLTELAQAGLSGGRAGTSLRVAFLRLVNPTADAAKELDKLNVAVRDANGNLKPGVFTDIADALEGYTKAQRDAALATIFGSDAIRAAAIIGNKGTLAFLQTSAAINEVGLAQQQAAARTAGLQGAFENLNNQVGSLGLALGEIAKGPATSMVNALADIASGASETANNLVSAGTKIKGFTKDVDDAVPILGQFDSHLGDIAKAGFLLNPLTGQFKAISEAAKSLGDNSDAASAKTDKYGNSIDGVGASLSDLSKNLLQSAADSRAFTEQVTSDTAALLQSAADSRVDLSKLGQQPIQAPKAFNVKKLQNIIQGFDAQQVIDKIKGDNTKLLADLQAEQAFLTQQLQTTGVKNRPALQRALQEALLGTVTDIRGIQAAAKAKSDKFKADAQKIADDNAKAVEDGAKALEDSIADAGKAIIALAKAQQRAQEEQRRALLQGFDLDISFDQITGNQTQEIKDRKRKIAELNKELGEFKTAESKTTVAYKEIRNEIAEQNAALKAIQAEKQKGQSFAQASFDFLQTQQGFASSLLGNLIPGTQTGGVVGGGGSPVQQALTPVADTTGKSGPTSGQANATNSILARILEQLKVLNGGQAAPEANQQAAWQRSTMDYHS